MSSRLIQSCLFTTHFFIICSSKSSLGLPVCSPRNWSSLITDSTKRNAVRKVCPAAQAPVIGTGVKIWTCILSLQEHWEPLPETNMWNSSIPVYGCGSFLEGMVVHLVGCYVLFWFVLVLVIAHPVFRKNSHMWDILVPWKWTRFKKKTETYRNMINHLTNHSRGMTNHGNSWTRWKHWFLAVVSILWGSQGKINNMIDIYIYVYRLGV